MIPLYPNVLTNWPGDPMGSLRKVHLYVSEFISQPLWNYYLLSFSVASKAIHNYLKKAIKKLLSSPVTFMCKAGLSSYTLINVFLSSLSTEADKRTQLFFVKSNIKRSCNIVKQYRSSHKLFFQKHHYFS